MDRPQGWQKQQGVERLYANRREEDPSFQFGMTAKWVAPTDHSPDFDEAMVVGRETI